MKKCRVTLSENVTKTKYFYLFPESSLLHSLVKKSNKKNLDVLLKTHPEVEVISLKRGQWLEVEWNGCDISYDGNTHISTSFLRLIKATIIPKRKNDGSLISVHFGWLLSDHLRMSEGSKDGINIEFLKEHDEQFEFTELFQDNETAEDLLRKNEQLNII